MLLLVRRMDAANVVNRFLPVLMPPVMQAHFPNVPSFSCSWLRWLKRPGTRPLPLFLCAPVLQRPQPLAEKKHTRTLPLLASLGFTQVLRFDQ